VCVCVCVCGGASVCSSSCVLVLTGGMAVGVELCHSAGQRRQSLPSPAHSHFIIIVIIVVAGYSQGPSLSSAQL